MKSRGFRNNNPLNIIHSKHKFIGEIKGKDKKFKTFSSKYYGYRAAFVILKTYYKKYKLCSIETIVKRWSATDQLAYINYICKNLGYKKNDTLPWASDNPILWINLIRSMAEFENGVKVSDVSDITKLIYNCVL